MHPPILSAWTNRRWLKWSLVMHKFQSEPDMTPLEPQSKQSPCPPSPKIFYPEVLHRDRHAGSHPLELSLEYCLCYPLRSASGYETLPENDTRGVRQFNSATCRGVSCSPLQVYLTDRV